MNKYIFKSIIPFLVILISSCSGPDIVSNSGSISSDSSSNSESSSLSENSSISEDPTSESLSSDSSNSEISSSSPSISEISSIDDYSNYISAVYSGYYDSFSSWTNGEDLINKLHNLINKDFVGYEYRWDIPQNIDEDPFFSNNVSLLYTGESQNKTNTASSSNTKGWEREHAFCQSLMGVNVSTSSYNMASDYHNLWASDKGVNNSHGNANYGEVNEALSTKINYSPDCYGNPTENKTQSISEGSNVYIFEPSDTYKGLLSRSIFYMATMYNSSLSVVENLTSTGSKAMGNLSTLLSWSNYDSYQVSLKEYLHNEKAYQFQKNRNPFVDFPPLVEYAFGSKKDQQGSLSSLEPSAYRLNVTNSKISEPSIRNISISKTKVNYKVGETLDYSDLEINKVLSDNSTSKISIDENITFSINSGYQFVTSDIIDKNTPKRFEVVVTYLNKYSSTIYLNVEENTKIDEANFLYVTSSATSDPLKSLYNNTTIAGVPQLLTLPNANGDSIPFSFYIKSSKVYSFSTTLGRQIGLSTGADTIYFETQNSIELGGKSIVTSVQVQASTGAGVNSGTISIYADGVLVSEVIDMVEGTDGNNNIYSIDVKEGTTGKIKILFQGFTSSNGSSAALYLARLAINLL